MINTYSYYESDADKLNEFVLSFFNRIEFETTNFSIAFFEQEFYDKLVCRHEKILLKAFKNIYNIIKTWDQSSRTKLCNAIRESNKIEEICKGNIIPTKSYQIPDSVKLLLITLYKKLYADVLFGVFYIPEYGTRKDHYHNFVKHKNNEHKWCPACGIRPMHRYTEKITDQYDHYLPKDIYPFSSVNFKNLVPICSDCNSLENKSNFDVLLPTGKAFYPFDDKRKPIQIDISIAKNDCYLDKIQWSFNYSCEVGDDEELDAWKRIYKIEDRHVKYCAGNIKFWYKEYWDYFTDKDSISDQPDETKRGKDYLRTKKSDQFESKCLSLITIKDKAIIESQIASRY